MGSPVHETLHVEKLGSVIKGFVRFLYSPYTDELKLFTLTGTINKLWYSFNFGSRKFRCYKVTRMYGMDSKCENVYQTTETEERAVLCNL